jgi:hypothetical protein
MSKGHTFLGYVFLAGTLFLCLAVLAFVGASPWLNPAAVLLALLVARLFLRKPNPLPVVALVAIATGLFPLAVLLAIGRTSGISPLPYLGLPEVLQMTLPTLVAAGLLPLIFRRP